VPKRWYSTLGDAAFLPYGLVLGASVFTPIVFPTLFTVLLLSGAASPSSAVAAGALYGGVRAVLTAAPPPLLDVERMAARRDRAQVVATWTLGALSVVATVVLLS
jgi:hypothetical protein